MTPTTYPDPRGHRELRTQIAAYLAIAHGIRGVPDHVIVTACYRAGLAMALQVLAGQQAWIEGPCYSITLMGLPDQNPFTVALPDWADPLRWCEWISVVLEWV